MDVRGLLQGLLPLAPPPPTYRRANGSLLVPAQSVRTVGPVLSHFGYTSFTPGITESPGLAFETWLIHSFAIPLTVSCGSEAVAEKEEQVELSLEFVIFLDGRVVFAQEIGRTVPNAKLSNRFTFGTTTFANLTEPIRYTAGSHLSLAITGLWPKFTGPETEAAGQSEVSIAVPGLQIPYTVEGVSP
jgi:hypothetical protein